MTWRFFTEFRSIVDGQRRSRDSSSALAQPVGSLLLRGSGPVDNRLPTGWVQLCEVMSRWEGRILVHHRYFGQRLLVLVVLLLGYSTFPGYISTWGDFDVKIRFKSQESNAPLNLSQNRQFFRVYGEFLSFLLSYASSSSIFLVLSSLANDCIERLVITFAIASCASLFCTYFDT